MNIPLKLHNFLFIFSILCDATRLLFICGVTKKYVVDWDVASFLFFLGLKLHKVEVLG